ncbi:MAG: lysine--tRNA ligase, partial [Gammaproteobacteria bacterium]|nr:lysine--tRNA ligase [Gammaproteobacteria bacterium]
MTNGGEAAEQGATNGAEQKQELNFLMQARREKLDRLRAAGVEPFGYSFDRTHTATEAVAALGSSEEGP